MVTAPAPPASLAEALAQLQSQLPRVAREHTAKVETKTGGNYKYAYADLTDVSAALLPVLAALGLSFSAAPTMLDGAFVLDYVLKHVSGEQTGGLYPLPDPNRLGPQDLGKAITYARRYALCAVTGLAPGGDDDDAHSAEQAHHAAQRKPRNVPDAQLAAEGRMTRREASAHDSLAADTRRASKRAERTRPRSPEQSQWDRTGPVDAETGERDTEYVNGQRAAQFRQQTEDDQPEDRPGSILPGQHRALERLLSMYLGDASRDTQHATVAGILGLDDLPPREDGKPSLLGLSNIQARTVVRELDRLCAEERRKNA